MFNHDFGEHGDGYNARNETKRHGDAYGNGIVDRWKGAGQEILEEYNNAPHEVCHGKHEGHYLGFCECAGYLVEHPILHLWWVLW